MKAIPASLLLVSVFILGGATASAQSARQLTRRIVPPPTAQPTPAPPPSRPAPQPPAVRAPAAPTTPPVVLVPVRPADPAKVQKEKEEVVQKTIEFQKKRAAEGSPSAQYELGLRYLNGDGLEKDEKEGRKLLEESAKNGSSLAKKKIEELDERQKSRK
jgi:hypothetical protein